MSHGCLRVEKNGLGEEKLKRKKKSLLSLIPLLYHDRIVKLNYSY